MMNWLLEAIQDSNGRASSKRLGLVIATTALSIACLILSVATLYGHDTALALASVAAPLAGLNGFSYVKGIHADNETWKLKDVT